MTTPDQYAALAALVITKCAAYDPYLPEPTEEQARAWGEQLALHGLNDPEVLTATVTRVYSEHGSGYRPLPKDITDAARAIRKERDQAGPSPQYQALCESKAAADHDMKAIEGPTIPVEEAKRIVREKIKRVGKPPGHATQAVEERLRQRAQEQRLAGPPAPLPEVAGR